MNTTLKYSIIVVLLILVGIFLYRKNNEDKVCYILPDSGTPNIFGPYYWKAFHEMSHRIPCGECRTFAERFMIFFHDVVNKKLGKPIYNQSNYNEVLKEINAQPTI